MSELSLFLNCQIQDLEQDTSDLRREPSGDRNRSVISDHCFCTDRWVGEIPESWCEDFFSVLVFFRRNNTVKELSTLWKF